VHCEVSFVWSGDDNQLPPVKDDPQYDKTPKTGKGGREAWDGNQVFDSFNVGVSLVHNFRQAGASAEQQTFRDMLGRLAVGEQTKEDAVHYWLKLNKNNLSVARRRQFEDHAIHLCARKSICKSINQTALSELEGPFAVWKATHFPNSKAARAASRDLAGLQKSTALAAGAHVILTSNQWISRGLVNGSIGVVRHILYASQPSNDCMPAVILVEFRQYAGPALLPLPHHTQLVPILPTDSTFTIGQKTFRRTNFPLELSYGLTIHKSQGMTFGEHKPIWGCIVHLGPAEDSNGLVYVALSRPEDAEHVILGGEPGEPIDVFPGGSTDMVAGVLATFGMNDTPHQIALHITSHFTQHRTSHNIALHTTSHFTQHRTSHNIASHFTSHRTAHHVALHNCS
jgi:hypothetical protein